MSPCLEINLVCFRINLLIILMILKCGVFQRYNSSAFRCFNIPTKVRLPKKGWIFPWIFGECVHEEPRQPRPMGQLYCFVQCAPHGPVTLCISIKPAMIHQIVSKWGCKPFWGNSLVLMRAASPAPECWHCIDAYVRCKWSLRVSYTHIHTHVIETATTLIDQEQQTVSSCHTEGGLIVQTVIRLSSKWD